MRASLPRSLLPQAAALVVALASTFPRPAAAADRSPLDREVQELIDEAEKAAKRLEIARARELWARVFEGWVHRCAEAIEAERLRGAAPAGPPARDIAVALTSMNERVLYATFTGDGPALAEDGAVDVLLEVWLRAIYGTAPAD